MQVWTLLEQHAQETDASKKDGTHQIYGSVATLYHKFRPKYPSELLTAAIEQSPLLQTTNHDSHSSPAPNIL